jgi:hypothetical protein
MIASVSLDRLKRAHYYEFLVRFILGGLVTAATTLILKQWGPLPVACFSHFRSFSPQAFP